MINRNKAEILNTLFEVALNGEAETVDRLKILLKNEADHYRVRITKPNLISPKTLVQAYSNYLLDKAGIQARLSDIYNAL